MTQYTPLLQQYLDLKSRHEDALLFFRVGDFYEMFFDDARECSRLLGITLTSRNNGNEADVPLAGVPVKAVDEYLPRLLETGRSVAVAEQVEDASEADGLVKREVVEVVTPGTVLEDTLLTADRNNFVAALAGTDPVGVASADLSTGEFEIWSCSAERLADELARLEPTEIVVPRGSEGAPEGRWVVTSREGWQFEPSMAEETLRRIFDVASSEGFGLDVREEPHLVAAAGALLTYLEEVRPAGLDHLRRPRVERAGSYMHLDDMTRRNLELVEPLRSDGGGTVLEVVDRTLTAMGGRALRRWLLHPLLDLEAIRARHQAVGELVREDDRRESLRDRLREVGDLERLAGKISTGRATPRELLALRSSLEELPEAVAAVGRPDARRLAGLVDGFDPLEDVRSAIADAVAPDAPPTLGDGGVIRTGHSGRLDDLRRTRDEAVEFIADLQARERERTGIGSLKVGHNKVFGYYIEVTKANLDSVPDDYHRKQTLSNAERYFTPELKEWEEKVTTAEERIEKLEAELFGRLRDELAGEVARIQASAGRVAELDVLAALADLAVRNGYVRPEVHDGYRLEIEGGRHPVVEELMAREDFIPNDVVLDRDGFVMVLTGPNMSGKSTVLRQVGLVVLLAQIGSFVPADGARIGLCDRIFTRVGASDNLVRGQSTFMVEMTETATILNQATGRSLVLLDEIGRGTSTYDGVSIAWAVTEFLHEVVGARTIFATHYHELVELSDRLDGVVAANVAVREVGDGIVFLRRLEPGGCDRSYGVHVARLAGVPGPVVERARAVLHELEAGPEGAGTRLARLADADRDQLNLFREGRSGG
ncbi:MAG: DNA mismatch repair protein MutS, partial [Gemmatimonadota bacterium]